MRKMKGRRERRERRGDKWRGEGRQRKSGVGSHIDALITILSLWSSTTKHFLLFLDTLAFVNIHLVT